MAIKLKSNIGYTPVVEEVSRKFVPRKEVCRAGGSYGPTAFEGQGWMGGGVKKTYRAGLGNCTRNFLVVRANARITNPSQDEMQARNDFARATRGAAHIMKDLSQLSSVQAKWAEAVASISSGTPKRMHGVSVNGYTQRGWVMAVQYAGIVDAREEGTTYNENQFPTAFDA